MKYLTVIIGVFLVINTQAQDTFSVSVSIIKGIKKININHDFEVFLLKKDSSGGGHPFVKEIIPNENRIEVPGDFDLATHLVVHYRRWWMAFPLHGFSINQDYEFIFLIDRFPVDKENKYRIRSFTSDFRSNAKYLYSWDASPKVYGMGTELSYLTQNLKKSNLIIRETILAIERNSE